MLLSMTGFGSAHGQVDGVEFDIEARSVNNRFFKFSVKVPDSHNPLESDIEKRIRKRLSRGTVTLSVRMRMPPEQTAYEVNTAALDRYVEQLQRINSDSGQAFQIDLASMLTLPGVCTPPSTGDLCQRTQAGLLELVDEAVEALMIMRGEEGKALVEDLRQHCGLIKTSLTTVAATAPDVLRMYHERLTVRVKELMGQGRASLDDQILAREVAVFAERSDIAEELSRLAGHLDQFDKALDADEPVGRKLDFIAQEMLREANTIASKANDASIAREVVDIKTAVDRIKEQVQNVE